MQVRKALLRMLISSASWQDTHLTILGSDSVTGQLDVAILSLYTCMNVKYRYLILGSKRPEKQKVLDRPSKMNDSPICMHVDR